MVKAAKKGWRVAVEDRRVESRCGGQEGGGDLETELWMWDELQPRRMRMSRARVFIVLLAELRGQWRAGAGGEWGRC